MLEELLPTGLKHAASRLGVDPLEVVRLLVVTEASHNGFALSDDQVDRLAEFGGIERGWWDGAELPSDDNAIRARVRAALGLLLGRTAGGTQIRMDNLWRGLKPEQQSHVEDAMNVLADEGLVQITNAQSGVLIGVPSSQVDNVRELAAGKGESPGLNELYQG